MTKPITVVAAVNLLEQGRFHMQVPIGKYLPAFTNSKVYIGGADELMVSEEAQRAIRVSVF